MFEKMNTLFYACNIILCGNAWNKQLRACLHGGGRLQVGEVTLLGGVTCLSISSLILIDHVYDRFMIGGVTHQVG